MRSASDLSCWSVDDVARYIADADSALSSYSELFRKHVGFLSVMVLILMIDTWVPTVGNFSGKGHGLGDMMSKPVMG